MNRSLSHSLLAAIACLIPITSHAQSAAGEAAPSMNPDAATRTAPAESKDPFGMGLTKDRPKGAKTDITAKKQATFDNGTNIAEFEGNVVVKDPQFNLFCDRLKVTLSKDRKGLELVEAFGNVIIVQENTDASGKVVKATGRAGNAVFEPKSGNITLTVWPSVQHDANLQVATEEGTVMILNRAGKSQTTGGSKTSIVETGEQKAPF